MLQRRKRYKNRTILGYKTLAVGSINMAEVSSVWHGPHLEGGDSPITLNPVLLLSLLRSAWMDFMQLS